MDTDQLRAIPDPTQRAKAATRALAAARADILAIRAEAVAEMRKTMSLAQIAAELGVTRSRVQQYEQGK